MVRLRSDMEELQRCALDLSVAPPAWQTSEAMRETLDGALRDRLLAWGGGAGRKALLIGAGWTRLAVELVSRDMFVTVVDDSAERLSEVHRKVMAAGGANRLTITVGDYKDRSFESSAFNLTVAWDSLNRYTEHGPLLKKLTRELKTGGQLFLRAWTRPEAGEAPLERRLATAEETLRGAVRRALGVLPAGRRAFERQPTLLGGLARPFDRAALRASLEALLVVEDVTPHHVLAPDVADLAVHMAPALGRLVPGAVALDRRIVAARPGQARFLAVFAAKEKNLGKTRPDLI